MKIAYWDTAQGNPPRLFGQIKGTPTIKFVVPSKKNKRTSNKKKSISAYNGERKAAEMVSYAKNMMPNHIVKIKDPKKIKDTFFDKADKYALPKVLLFTKAKTTQAVTKALSTEFRRRALIATVKLSKVNIDLVKQYKVNTKENNVLMVVPDEGEPIVMTKKFSMKNCKKFLDEHALKKPYFEDEAAMAKIAARDGAEKAEL